jgi:hypothetical protein
LPKRLCAVQVHEAEAAPGMKNMAALAISRIVVNRRI